MHKIFLKEVKFKMARQIAKERKKAKAYFKVYLFFKSNSKKTINYNVI